MKYIIANYKMHLGTRESAALARGVLRGIRGAEVLPELVLCPSFPALADVRKIIVRSHIALGAQDVATESGGAMTGETSATQLVDVGCQYVIVGHSERRRLLRETDADVHKKILHAHDAGIIPIVCVGETAEQRAAGQAEAVVRAQVVAAFDKVTQPRRSPILVAYEPVWAIGSGTPATPADAVAMHRVIHQAVTDTLRLTGEAIVVLYGGSVDGTNAHQFLREREIGGVLVGGASIKIHEFSRILEAAVEVLRAQS